MERRITTWKGENRVSKDKHPYLLLDHSGYTETHGSGPNFRECHSLCLLQLGLIFKTKLPLL